MAIGWYPGHMNKARKDIMKALKQVDLVVEILDARLPASSTNPLLDKLIGELPRLKVLNKSDLADPGITASWMAYFHEQGQATITQEKDGDFTLQQILQASRQPHRPHKNRIFRFMIVGIPNVGKSTLMNKLLKRKLAKVGNEPAVTKAPQETSLAEGFKLIDTPGVLWPKIEDQEAAYRLAASGAIRNTAIEFEDIALFTLAFMNTAYPENLLSRYKLTELAAEPIKILEQIAEKRGALRKGGVDYHKASEIILNDFRSGALGFFSMEKPPLTFGPEIG
jgi:ribosome biogenesis GTPase A